MATDTTSPLQDIHVVSLAFNVPGPVAVMKLSRLGASVTRIEPTTGDHFARWCPAWYADLCRDQTPVFLDLKTAPDREEMEGLLHRGDLFLTSIRPAALAHLCLDWENVHARHPRLCQVAIVGYPSPAQNRVGHDVTYLAGLGLISPPHLPRTLLADLAGAEQAVSAALALLYARERGQGAGFAEVALSASAEAFADPLRYGLTVPGSLLGGGSPRYNLYEAGEGWVAVAALEEHFWARLIGELGLAGRDATYEQLAIVFATRTAREWEIWAASRDLPIAAVL